MMHAYTLCGGNGLYKRYSLSHCLDAEKRLGISSLALTPYAAHFWINHNGHDDCTALLQSLQRRGMNAALLLPPPFQYSLCARTGTLQREITIEYYRHCFSVAQALRIPGLCVDARGGCADEWPQRLQELFADGIRSLLDIADDHGVKLMARPVSPLSAPSGSTLAEFEALCRHAGDRLGLLLDTAAIHQAMETIPQWFKPFQGRILHVLLSDSRNGGCRIWGEGCCPLDTYIAQLKEMSYEGPLGVYLETERYWDRPEEASRKNIAAVREALLGGL